MIPKELAGTNTDIKSILKSLSQQDFRNFGVQHLAYIRPVYENKKTFYSIHAADGSRLSVMETMQEASVAARMNDLEPVTVH